MTSTNKRLRNVALLIALAVVVIIQLVPFYVAITTALKERTDLSSQLLPPMDGISWGNFETAMESGNILRAILNSVIVTGASTFLVCILGAMAAYPLARRITLLNKGILLGAVGMMMIPPLSILVPLYTFLNQIGAVNTYWGITAVLVTTELPLAIFLYAAFMRNIPSSLEEAASIDGANRVQVLFRILFPLLKPVTATVVILVGVRIWNEFALSVYILTDPEVQTIAPAISGFFSAQGSNLGAAAAASLMAVTPVLIAYLFLQKYFMKGMVAGAEK